MKIRLAKSTMGWRMLSLLVVIVLTFENSTADKPVFRGSLNCPDSEKYEIAMESYSAMLRDIRKKVADTNKFGIPVLPPPPAARSSPSFFFIELDSHTGATITFAFTVFNLYLFAFKMGDTAYYLHDKSTTNPAVEISKVFLDVSAKNIKAFGRGDYDDLERKANKRRDEKKVGVESLCQSVSEMFQANKDPSKFLKQVASSLLTIVQMTSEAARFKVIEEAITISEGSWDEKPLDSNLVALENEWDSLSRALIKATTETKEVTEIKKKLALSKYVKN